MAARVRVYLRSCPGLDRILVFRDAMDHEAICEVLSEIGLYTQPQLQQISPDDVVFLG